MTQETQNTKVAQDAYAAFARGDMQALLGCFADDIVWNAVYGTGPHVPTSGVRRGKAAVAEFFKQVAANVSFSAFEPKEFVAGGRQGRSPWALHGDDADRQEFRCRFCDGVHPAQRDDRPVPGIQRQRRHQRGVCRGLKTANLAGINVIPNLLDDRVEWEGATDGEGVAPRLQHRDIFVTGGAGYIGARLIPALLNRGHRVRALVRGGSEHRLPSDCDVVVGDALDRRAFVTRVARADTLERIS